MVKKRNQERRWLWRSFHDTRLLWRTEVSDSMWLCVGLSVTGAVVGRHVETRGERTVEPDELEDCYNNCGEEAVDGDGKR
jgi:hypothetical protein